MDRNEFTRKLAAEWETSPRWKGIRRPYSPEDVWRLRGNVEVDHSLARRGAARLWRLLHEEPYVAALSAITGGQAVQEVRAGLKSVYVSGWQVAADANTALETYPDQSLYPADSVPWLVKRINQALLRADQIHHAKGDDSIDWMVPLVADAEAGFGGILNAFELMKDMIDAGAAAVHFEDQISSFKKCGHLGGKVLAPTREFVAKLVAARLAADVAGVDTIVIARTDALSGTLLANDIDPYDKPFVVSGERTHEGFFRVRGGIEAPIARALAYAPYADMLWCETSKPDIAEARAFAEGVHEQFPGKPLAYNCSPSFNWRLKLDEATIAKFQRELGAMGYRYFFVTLSAFHSMNHGMFELAAAYREQGMTAYANLQDQEFAAEKRGYEAVRHQEFVGTGWFDEVASVITGGQSDTLAMKGSTEKEQFKK